MEVDTHLGDKEVNTNALLENEVVEEELTDAKTKVIERIKICSNKTCTRQDLAKEKVVFSQESSQAIFEMGSVELIELKNSEFNARRVYTEISKEQFFAHAASSSDPTRTRHDESKLPLKFSMHSAFVPLSLIQGVTNTALTCGRNTTRRSTLCGVLKRAKENLRRI